MRNYTTVVSDIEVRKLSGWSRGGGESFLSLLENLLPGTWNWFRGNCLVVPVNWLWPIPPKYLSLGFTTSSPVLPQHRNAQTQPKSGVFQYYFQLFPVLFSIINPIFQFFLMFFKYFSHIFLTANRFCCLLSIRIRIGTDKFFVYDLRKDSAHEYLWKKQISHIKISSAVITLKNHLNFWTHFTYMWLRRWAEKRRQRRWPTTKCPCRRAFLVRLSVLRTFLLKTKQKSDFVM